jgi:hypothetical protein
MPLRSYQGYTAATRIGPRYHVPNLVFRGGTTLQRTGSLTGGGQIYGHEYSSGFQPYIKSYSTPVTNMVAGGQVVALPPFLQALFGGKMGTSS